MATDNIKLKLVQGDTRPQVKTVVKDDETGLPLDVSAATVRMLFRQAGNTLIQATLTGTLLTGLENADGTINTSAPYDVPGVGGRVVFPWVAGDLDCDPGDYEGEIKVTFADSTTQSVYEPLKFRVREKFGA